MLTSVHAALDPRIFQKQARSLARAGYAVSVVAPGGCDRTLDGVSIRTVRRPRSRLHRIVVSALRVTLRGLSSAADVYHVHDPELLPFALLLRLTGAKVVYDAHEDLPRDVLDKAYLAPWSRVWIARLTALAEHVACRYLSGVVVASPDQQPRLAKANANTVTIRNLVELETLGLCHPPPPFAQRRPWAVYAGRLSVDRGVKEAVAAMAHLPATCPARLQLAGPWDNGLKGEVASYPGWHRVDHHRQLDRQNVGALLVQSQVGILAQHATDSIQRAWPTKLFEYMAAGLPVVATNMPLYRDLVGDFGCAVFVDAHDPAAIGGAIHYLLTHPAEAESMGQRARRAVLEHYNWASEERGLLAYYARLSGLGARRPA